MDARNLPNRRHERERASDMNRPTETIALKPCPCCGGSVRGPFTSEYADNHPEVWIECTPCNLLMTVHDTEDESLVATRWNTRLALEPDAKP